MSIRRCLSNIYKMATTMVASSRPKQYTRSEVAAHNRKFNLWIIYREKVYNMTPYFKHHPGGDAMMRRAGRDVTYVLRMVEAHSLPWNFIEKKLAECYVGDLKS